jgi:hypothetical protein
MGGVLRRTLGEAHTGFQERWAQAGHQFWTLFVAKPVGQVKSVCQNVGGLTLPRARQLAVGLACLPLVRQLVEKGARAGHSQPNLATAVAPYHADLCARHKQQKEGLRGYRTID